MDTLGMMLYAIVGSLVCKLVKIAFDKVILEYRPSEADIRDPC